MESTRTNVQNKDNGVITFTREITWLRGMETGWGNGYVALPEGHPLYGKNYDDVQADCHGGLTYGNEEEIDGTKYWVYGFDCAHYMDNSENCSEPFVISETENLYNQLAVHNPPR